MEQKSSKIDLHKYGQFSTKVQFNGKRIIFLTEGGGTTGILYGEKIHFDRYRNPLYKISSKYSIDLSVKPKTLKLLGIKNPTGEHPCDLGLSKDS